MLLKTPWRRHMAQAPRAHTFAIGDVHGQADALATLLDHLDLQRTPKAIEREIIFLGDLIDRGPDSLSALDLAMDADRRADRRWILPGNHELMLLDTLEDPNHPHWNSWYLHGGREFLLEIDPDDALPFEKELQLLRAALPQGFEVMLRQGPTHLQRGGFLFVHAGINPAQSLESIFAARRRFSMQLPDYERHWAWIREPFLEWHNPWPQDGVDLVVHGHEATTTGIYENPCDAGALMLCPEGAPRVNLDAGAAYRPQVAALEVLGPDMRLHIVAPRPWLPL